MDTLNIEFQRNFRLYDDVTVVWNGNSYYRKIVGLSEYGLTIVNGINSHFIEWKDIQNAYSHEY